MARTALFSSLRRLFAAAEIARRTGRSPAEVLGAAAAKRGQRGPTRRDVLRTTAGAAVLLPLAACGDDLRGNDLDVAIVGAGVAGLHCAMRLAEAGLDVAVFEASG